MDDRGPLAGRIHRTAFGLLDTVYHALDSDREDTGIVTTIKITPEGHLYQVTWKDRSVGDYFSAELLRAAASIDADPTAD